MKELLKESYAPEVGKEIFLVRESENRVDRNAVLVIYCDGRKLGYLKRKLAAFVASILNEGVVLTGKVMSL